MIEWINQMLPELLDPRLYCANLLDPRREMRNNATNAMIC